MLGRPDDARLLRLLLEAAEGSAVLIRRVCACLSNKQIVKILEECCARRDMLAARTRRQLADLEAPPADAEPPGLPTACFSLPAELEAEGDEHGPLLERLAACDDQLAGRLAEAASPADLSAQVRLMIDEATELFALNAKRFRRIVAQANRKRSDEAAA
ncbi:hypothetical protein [Sphingomicrobium astaxanthinifaciens]|uniref:hypothetical protein n=1 Tax=Sphingomicrobium astaxanthinifaciens TaxID=1227949 RepID=UPI001FCC70EF|nr:hypothetical protein [Sphingomicrobium astaxanthinifaciens]MCJ7421874.1 hypothetical protein [Sphingomicrobium astaxanthinifaciens]